MMPFLDIEKASEYLNIAATIIDIKARSLVPPTDEYFDDYIDDENDPKQELIRALEEYEMIKEEADKLKERETVGYFFKQPDKDMTAVRVQYKDLTLDGLVNAFTKMMMKRENQKDARVTPRSIPKDRYTVREKIQHIRTAL